MIANTQSQGAAQNPVSGIVDTPVSATLNGLTQGTPYYFRLKAVSEGGTVPSITGTFTTPTLPVLTASTASGIGVSSATLNGTANPNGLASIVEFAYGTDGVTFANSVSATPWRRRRRWPGAATRRSVRP